MVMSEILIQNSVVQIFVSQFQFMRKECKEMVRINSIHSLHLDNINSLKHSFIISLSCGLCKIDNYILTNELTICQNVRQNFSDSSLSLNVSIRKDNPIYLYINLWCFKYKGLIPSLLLYREKIGQHSLAQFLSQKLQVPSSLLY